VLGRAPVHPEIAAEIHARSGGNPFYVRALSEAKQSYGDVRSLLLDRAARLPANARSVLDLIAVAAGGTTDEVLATVCDLPESDLAAALRILLDNGQVLIDGERYQIRHDLLREVVYDELLPLQRRTAHRRFATALEELPGDRTPEIAWHWDRAGAAVPALRWAWSAADRSRRLTAYQAELDHLRSVLRWWDEVPGADEILGVDRMTVLTRAVDAALGAGADDAGFTFVNEALDATDAAEVPVRYAGLLGRLARLQNRADLGGRSAVESALDLVPPGADDAVRCRLLALAAAIALPEHRVDDAATLCDEALRLAERLGDDSSAAQAHACLTWPLSLSGDFDAAGKHYQAAVAAAERAGDTNSLLGAHQWWSAQLLLANNFGEALAVARFGADLAEQNGLRSSRGPMLRATEVDALMELGRWDEAVAVVEDALAGRSPGLYGATLSLFRAEIAVARGDVEVAEQHLRLIQETTRSNPRAESILINQNRVAMEIALAAGDIAAADHLVGRLLDRGPAVTRGAFALGRVVLTAFRVQRARREQAPHDHDVAAAVAERKAALAAFLDRLTGPEVFDAACRATVAAEQSDSLADWDNAVAAWAATGNRYEQALVLHDAAKCALATSNRSGAARRIREAEELARSLGAQPLLARLARLRERSGDREPATRPEIPWQLTERELDVLRCLARGMTNKQIAAELFLSANTVGTHVTRIFTKLSVTSRAAAVALAHESGLSTSLMNRPQ